MLLEATRTLQVLKARFTEILVYLDSFPNFRRLLAICILHFFSLRYYVLSLAGGEVDWVKANLFRLGIYILVAVLLFCISFVLAVGLHPPKYRIITIMIMLLTVTYVFLIDRGDSFKNHGSYNALVFGVLSFIILSITLSIMLCHHLSRRKDIFWRVLIIGTLLLVLLTVLRLSYYRSIWVDGLLNHQMSRDPKICSFEYNGNWPMMDLLPDGLMNFWTGRQTCPPQAFKIDAKIDATGLLTMSCAPGTGPAFYTILPDTKLFQTSEKIIGKLHIAIRERSVKSEYKNPVPLTPQQEAVIVQCGEVEELRYNLQIPERFKKFLEGRGESLKQTGDDQDDGKDETKKENLRGRGDALSRRPVNTMVIFLDAVARRHMFRKLKKTMETLQSLHTPTDNGKGSRLFQFFRYHIVGFNTNHNTRAMFTGNRTEDPPRRTIVEDAFQFGSPIRMTARAETNCEDWSSEYNGRATSASYDHELIAPFCQPSYYPHDGHPFGNFKGPYSILRRCLYDRYVHRHTFDYIEGLLRMYRNQAPSIPWFITGSFIEGHEGTGEVLATLDKDLSNFLIELSAQGQLQNTALYILSDHGLHMGLNYVYNTNGIIEHANPALFALLPERILSQEHIDTLNHNEQALMTAVNVYHTWRDVMGLKFDQNKSLLRTPLPLDATCDVANIEGEYCQCKYPKAA